MSYPGLNRYRNETRVFQTTINSARTVKRKDHQAKRAAPDEKLNAGHLPLPDMWEEVARGYGYVHSAAGYLRFVVCVLDDCLNSCSNNAS